MNNNNKLVALMLGAFVMAGFNSCSDDHFDVVGSGSNSTLWQTIASTPELSDFKEIVEKTVNMSNENDSKTTTTFDRLLDGETRYTVWAPKNGTYDAAKYKALLEQAEQLKTSDPEKALDCNYTVLNQFVKNHVANFNYEANVGEQTVRMNNSKVAEYNASTGTFNGVKLDATLASLPAKNGMLHVLDGYSPYRYNILDLFENTPELSEVYDYIASQDVKEFNENMSTAGGTDENGNIQYIDSVYTTTNDLLTSSNASISAEDSLYLVVVPTNAGWNDAISKVKSLYKYKSSYKYRWEDEDAVFTQTKSDLNADSLSEANARAAILTNMYFSAGQLGDDVYNMDDAAVIQQMTTADSLLTTTDMVVYNTNLGGVNPIFGSVVPDTASNGYVYKVDQFNYTIAGSYQPKITMEGSDASLYYAANSNMNLGGNIQDNVLTLNTDQIAADTVVPGASAYLGKQYLRVVRRGRSAAWIDLKVFDLLSGKYDVYVTMLPSKININTNSGSECETKGNMVAATLIDDAGETFASSSNLTYSADTVSTFKLFSDLEVPYCYTDIPDLEWSSSDNRTFVRLRLTIPANRSQGSKADNMALNIYEIRFVPKD